MDQSWKSRSYPKLGKGRYVFVNLKSAEGGYLLNLDSLERWYLNENAFRLTEHERVKRQFL